MDDGDPEVAAALAAASAALESVLARPDDPAKFRAVSQLSDGFQALQRHAAAERPGIVKRIREKDELALVPLSKLSAELGVSKTRTHQLYAAAKEGP